MDEERPDACDPSVERAQREAYRNEALRKKLELELQECRAQVRLWQAKATVAKRDADLDRKALEAERDEFERRWNHSELERDRFEHLWKESQSERTRFERLFVEAQADVRHLRRRDRRLLERLGEQHHQNASNQLQRMKQQATTKSSQ